MFGHGCLLSFRGNLFVIYTLSNMTVLWSKLFIQKFFSKNGMAMRNPQKISEKRVGKGQVGDKWGQVGVLGTSGTRRRGSSDLRGTRGTRTRGLSTWTIPLVLNGTTRPWKITNVFYYTDWSNIDEFCCQKRPRELWLNMRILAEILLETWCEK